MNATPRSDDRTEEPQADGPPESTEPAESGLRDPQRAIRALGACVLGLEALVLLMAVVPLNMLDVPYPGAAIGVVLALAAVAVVLAGMMRRTWAWHAGTALQIALLPCAVFHWALAAIGLIFGAVWLYAWHVRRVLSRPPVREN